MLHTEDIGLLSYGVETVAQAGLTQSDLASTNACCIIGRIHVGSGSYDVMHDARIP